MFTERKLLGVSPRPLTANGTAYGLVTVANSAGLFVKQQVILSNNSTSVVCEIKRFISDTQFYVGPKGGIDQRQDLSAFTLATSPQVSAIEQDRQNIRPDDFERAVYVEEPVVAKRVIPVDSRGKYYDSSNPAPVYISDKAIYDKIVITRDLDKDISKVEYKLDGVTQDQYDLVYDIDKDLVEVNRS
jgi:hypothetical protein